MASMRSLSDALALALALPLLATGCKEEKKEAPLVITASASGSAAPDKKGPGEDATDRARRVPSTL
jgi:hypothetical protein